MYCAFNQQPARLSRRNCACRVLFILFAVVIPIIVSAGCRTDPNCRRETALMRAEILDIEDKYAALKSKYEANALRLHELTGEPIDETIYDQDSNYHETVLNEEYLDGEIVVDEWDATGAPIVVEDPGLMLSSPVDTIEPAMDLPPVAPQAEPDSLPLPNDSSDSGAFQLDVPGVKKFQRNRQARTVGARRSRSAITEIVVNRGATRGQDVDGVVGDEGLNLMLQPKSANGRVTLKRGGLSVSIVDPKLRKRIGFWRFLPEEVELFHVNDEIAGKGILLHLPWDEANPTRARLLVHVEFVTEDGRALKTSSDVLIKPPTSNYSPDDPLVVRWTQRDPRWPGGDATADQRWEQSAKNGSARFSRSARTQARLAAESKADSASSVNSDQPKWRPVR